MFFLLLLFIVFLISVRYIFFPFFFVGPAYCALKVFVLYDSVNKPVSVVE